MYPAQLLMDSSFPVLHVLPMQCEQAFARVGFPTPTEGPPVHFIPISALKGANVIDNRGEHLSWYKGPTLLSAIHSSVQSISSVVTAQQRWELVRPSFAS